MAVRTIGQRAIGAALAFCLTPLTILVSGAPVQAYNDAHCRKNDRLTYYSIQAYPGPSGNAINDWVPGTVMAFSPSSSPEMTIGLGDYGNSGYAGITYTYCGTGVQTLASTSYYNAYYTDAYTATHKRAIMVHEIGHAIGLGHTGPGDCPRMRIMYPTDPYALCAIFTPQADDRAGINAIY